MLSLKLVESSADLPMGGDRLSHLHEGSHDIQSYLYGSSRVEDRRSHERAVLGEHQRQRRGEFELLEVITSCDHLQAFCRVQPEGKICRKATGISSHRLIQHAGLDTVERRQIRVQNHPPPPDGQDARRDLINRQHSPLQSA